MDNHGHDFGPVSELHRPCKKCGYRLTLVAEMIAALDGEKNIPLCPGARSEPKPQGCRCDMKNLLSTGHDPGCPEKRP